MAILDLSAGKQAWEKGLAVLVSAAVAVVHMTPRWKLGMWASMCRGSSETRSRLVHAHPRLGWGLAPHFHRTEIFGSFAAYPQLTQPGA